MLRVACWPNIETKNTHKCSRNPENHLVQYTQLFTRLVYLYPLYPISMLTCQQIHQSPFSLLLPLTYIPHLQNNPTEHPMVTKFCLCCLRYLHVCHYFQSPAPSLLWLYSSLLNFHNSHLTGFSCL